MNGTLWTAADKDRLRTLWADQSLTRPLIAQAMRRSTASVCCMARELVLPHKVASRTKPGPNDWPKERLELAKTLWLDGKSAGQIAAVLGNVSRSAVSGQLHRLGLTRALTAPHATRSKANYRSARKAATERVGVAGNGMVFDRGPDRKARVDHRPAAWLPIPGSDPQTLLETGHACCRWPVSGGDEQLFCALPTGGQTYCSHHTTQSKPAVAPKFPVTATQMIRAYRRCAA